jgi:hypothetical protein
VILYNWKFIPLISSICLCFNTNDAHTGCCVDLYRIHPSLFNSFYITKLSVMMHFKTKWCVGFNGIDQNCKMFFLLLLDNTYCNY